MKRYIFTEQEFSNEYRYIFLCGSHYAKTDNCDKRNVLREFLKKEKLSYCPIILEDNFIFAKSKSRLLRYDDIYMKDLYQVEMVTNYMSDNNIIIHESISTGAETGLFLSEEQAAKKTCLLVSDAMSIEEDKIGQFIRWAFLETEHPIEVIRFYPRVESNVISADVRYWHTYFWEDKIGTNLANTLRNFLEKEKLLERIRFTKNIGKVKEGFVHYKKKNNILEITLLPRILLTCIAAVFNIEELSKKIFSAEEKQMKEYIEIIKQFLLDTFIHTIEEKTGDNFEKCSISAEMNIKRVHISQLIGMCLYFFQAAGFIEIVKADDYLKTKKVKINKKIVTFHDGTRGYFYKKYVKCIDSVIDTQIV